MNRFDIKAKEIEKRFFKKLRTGSYYLTGEGRRNDIVDFTNSTIYVKTKKSKKPLALSRRKIKEAISYLLYKRTATRKDLEKYANYNSALMGLLRLIFIEIAKIHKTVRGLLRISIKGVRFFFSGLDRPSKVDFESITKNQAMFVLNSYYWLRDKGTGLDDWMKKLEVNNIRLIVDSGAFSVFNAQAKGKTVVDKTAYESLKETKPKKEMNRIVKDICLEEYAAFINKYKHLIYGFFNLDVIGNPIQTQKNFERLSELTGTRPIPVWHCNVEDWRKSDFKLLDQIVNEDYELIAIGATVELGKRAGVRNQDKVKRELFEEIFKRHPQQNFHWLGGSSSLMLEFPFFSSDSSGWLQGRKKHQVYSFEDSQAATKVMPYWSKEKCLAFNVKSLSSLENIYDGIQMRLEF